MLELEAHLQGALARRQERAAADVVDEAESARKQPRRGIYDFGKRWSGRGIRHLQAVEDVGEVHSYRELQRMRLGSELEDAAQAHRFRRTALIAIVAVIGRRSSPLAIGWIHPRERI